MVYLLCLNYVAVNVTLRTEALLAHLKPVDAEAAFAIFNLHGVPSFLSRAQAAPSSRVPPVLFAQFPDIIDKCCGWGAGWT